MNTESAALCCGNRPSTHRSGRLVLVCRSCGDQLQGDTAEATIAAWNRAKSPAGTTMAFQIHRLGEFLLANFGPLSVTADGEQETVCGMAERVLGEALSGLRKGEAEIHRLRTSVYHQEMAKLQEQLFEANEEVRKAENERDGLREELQDAKRFAKNAEVDARDYLKAAESMNKTVVKLMAIVTETQSRADANWHEGERLRGQLAKAEAELVKAQKAEVFAKAWSRKTSPGGAQ